MEDDLSDLFPLFLGEARERVERLLDLAPQLASSTAAIVESRREFHTLKGSSRMLKLSAMADLCHQGEELLEVVGAGTVDRVTELLDRFSRLLEEVDREHGGPVAASTPTRPRPVAPAAEVVEARPVRLRVLLVEDSLVNREMERRLLEDEGFDVFAVSGAEQALTVLAEHAFDCIVTDIEMPGMNGLELTRRLRATARFAQLPVVVVSTLDRPEDRLAGLQAGADAYLSKHELQPHLVGTLIRHLGGHR